MMAGCSPTPTTNNETHYPQPSAGQTMKLKILLPLIVLAASGCASNNSISGRILTNANPYFLRSDDGDLYQVTWYSGYTVRAGDEVTLTNDEGACSMISKNGTAQVFVSGN
jgi:hypothetical protein